MHYTEEADSSKYLQYHYVGITVIQVFRKIIKACLEYDLNSLTFVAPVFL